MDDLNEVSAGVSQKDAENSRRQIWEDRVWEKLKSKIGPNYVDKEAELGERDGGSYKKYLLYDHFIAESAKSQREVLEEVVAEGTSLDEVCLDIFQMHLEQILEKRAAMSREESEKYSSNLPAGVLEKDEKVIMEIMVETDKVSVGSEDSQTGLFLPANPHYNLFWGSYGGAHSVVVGETWNESRHPLAWAMFGYNKKSSLSGFDSIDAQVRIGSFYKHRMLVTSEGRKMVLFDVNSRGVISHRLEEYVDRLQRIYGVDMYFISGDPSREKNLEAKRALMEYKRGDVLNIELKVDTKSFESLEWEPAGNKVEVVPGNINVQVGGYQWSGEVSEIALKGSRVNVAAYYANVSRHQIVLGQLHKDKIITDPQRLLDIAQMRASTIYIGNEGYVVGGSFDYDEQSKVFTVNLGFSPEIIGAHKSRQAVLRVLEIAGIILATKVGRDMRETKQKDLEKVMVRVKENKPGLVHWEVQREIDSDNLF